MAIQNMVVQNRSGGGGPTYQATQILNTPIAGPWIYIPKGTNRLSVIFNAGGSGRVEVTNDSQINIDADTVDPASISLWPDGNIVASKVGRLLWTGNAVRSVNISGTTKAFFFAN